MQVGSLTLSMQVDRIQQLRKVGTAGGAQQLKGVAQLRVLQKEAERVSEMEWEIEAVNQHCGILEKRLNDIHFEDCGYNC